jgi:hypothetical protein
MDLGILESESISLLWDIRILNMGISVVKFQGALGCSLKLLIYAC